MAEKILHTRILNKIDTLENWSKSTLKIKQGEICLATVAASAGTGLEEPVVMMKVGTAEEKTFAELPWAFYAKASDVLAACKTEAGLKAFVNTVIGEAGIATDEAMQELAGRVGDAEGKITALEGTVGDAEKGLVKAVADLNGLVGDKKVADQISTAIANLKLADTYAAKEHEHTKADITDFAHTHARADITDFAHNHEMGEVNGLVAALADKVDKVANKSLIADSEIERLAGMSAGANKVEASATNGSIKIDGVETVVYTHPNKHAIADVDGLQAALNGKQDVIPENTYDAHGAAAQALTDAKAYTDSEMTRLVGDTKVADQITTAITNLNLANTYDAKGAAAAAETAAKGHADGLNTAMDTRVKAVEGKAHTHTFVEAELNLIKAGDVAKWNAAEQNAKDYAKGLDDAMDLRVDALEAKFTGEGSVAGQIEAAVADEAALREAADKALQDQIGVASAEGVAATGLHADIERLEGLVGDEKVSEAIADAVAAEAAIAREAERVNAEAVTNLANGAVKANTEAIAKLNGDANTVGSVDYKVAQEVAKILNDNDATDIDTLEEIAAWIKNDTAGVGDLNRRVTDNTNAITKLNGDASTDGSVAKKIADAIAAENLGQYATDTELSGVDGRLQAVEGELNTATTGLKARMGQAEADIDALELKVGDKKVSEQISAVTDPLAARIVELEKVDHDHSNKTVLDGIKDTDVSAWNAKVDGVTAAADSGLKATRTGNAIAIEIDDTLTFVFDCGGAGV